MRAAGIAGGQRTSPGHTGQVRATGMFAVSRDCQGQSDIPGQRSVQGRWTAGAAGVMAWMQTGYSVLYSGRQELLDKAFRETARSCIQTGIL